MSFFEHKFPCDPSDFVHFRKRIGEEGVQINALLAATAWNLKKMMEKLKEKMLCLIFRFIFGKNFLPAV
jgi:hypothetical protein